MIRCAIYLVQSGQHASAMLPVLGPSCLWLVIGDCAVHCHMPAYVYNNLSFQEGLDARQPVMTLKHAKGGFGFIARYIMGVRELHRAIRQVARSGSVCRVRNVVALVRCFTLAVREFSSLVIRNLVSSPGGQSASRLSLWASARPPTMAGQTTGCLSAYTVYHEQMSLYSGIPPHDWKSWEECRNEVEPHFGSTLTLSNSNHCGPLATIPNRSTPRGLAMAY